MDQLITTIAFAFVFIALGVAGLAIGWLITGKKRLHGGGCGRAPNSNKKDCSLCQGNPKECDDDDKDDH